MKILVVEDERQLCDDIAEDLELGQYTAERCYDGLDAWERLLTEPYDLVILDLNLPGMDGLDPLRALRQEQLDVRVLILSARSALENRVEGLDLGADDYLTKPFALEELDGAPLALTRKEFGILEYLMLHPGKTVSQEELLEHIWETDSNPFSHSVRMHVSSLRKKLREALGHDPITTRIGQGYCLEVEP